MRYRRSLDDRSLLERHARALYTHDQRGRIVYVNERNGARQRDRAVYDALEQSNRRHRSRLQAYLLVWVIIPRRADHRLLHRLRFNLESVRPLEAEGKLMRAAVAAACAVLVATGSRAHPQQGAIIDVHVHAEQSHSITCSD